MTSPDRARPATPRARTSFEAVRDRLTRWHVPLLWCSVGFVVVAGLAYCLHLGDQLRYPDELQYLRIARNLADHAWYSVNGVKTTAFPPPGYPLVLGALTFLGAPVVVLRALNLLFMAIVVWGVWWLARRIGGPVAAAIAAPLTALYPLTFYTMGTLYPQPMASALLVVALVAVAGLRDSARPWWRAIGAGFAFSLLILSVPNLGIALLAVIVWLACTDRRWGPILVIVVCAAVLPTAWTVRNAVSMHAFIPIATSNDNLALGFSEHTTARSGIMVDLDEFREEIRRRHLNEVEASNYFTDEAIKWIKANPGRAFVLYVEKTANYFAPFDQLSDPSNNSVAQQVLATLTYLPLLLLLLIRLFRWRKDRLGADEVLLLAIYLLSAPTQAIFTTRVRYRAPLDPLLIVIVAGFLGRWIVARATGTGARLGDDGGGDHGADHLDPPPDAPAAVEGPRTADDLAPPARRVEEPDAAR